MNRDTHTHTHTHTIKINNQPTGSIGKLQTTAKAAHASEHDNIHGVGC